MAEEVEKVHEAALKVLREQTSGTTATTTPPATVTNRVNTATPSASKRRPSFAESRRMEEEVRRARTEREERLQAEARKRLADRAVQQAEERRQFEEFLRERERQRIAEEQPGTATADQTTEALQKLREATAAEAVSVPAAKEEPTISVTSSPATTEIETPATPVTPTAPALEEVRVENVAPSPTPVADSQYSRELEERAREILREQVQEQAPVVRRAPVTEAEVAPVVYGQTSPGQTAEIHEKALQVLRQQTATAPAMPPAMEPSAQAASPAARPAVKQPETRTNPAPAESNYSKELEQRALEILRQSNTGAASSSPAAEPAARPSAAAPSATPGADQAPVSAASADVHEKALQVLRQQPVPATSVDQRTREILLNQDREITRQARTPRFRPAARGLSPDAETRARDILRQQQEQLGGSSSAAAPAPSVSATPLTPEPVQPVRPVQQPQPVRPAARLAETVTRPAPAPTPTPAPATVAPAPRVQTENVARATTPPPEYSRELEERAREILRQRAQEQQSPAPAISTQPAVQPSVAQPAAPRIESTPPPAVTTTPQAPPNTEEVHRQALEALNRAANNPPAAQPAPTAPAGPKTKREKLREITGLYLADKMTPAEYHKRRAEILAEP